VIQTADTAATNSATPTPAGLPPSPGPGRRNRRLRIAGMLFAAIAAGAVAWHFLVAQYHVTTTNAYVGGDVVVVSPLVSGTVSAVRADDNQFVKAGDTLVELDDSDARVSLELARAQLATTVRGTRALFDSTQGLRAQLAANQAALERAQVELQRARTDQARSEAQLAIQAITTEAAEHARTATQNAEAGLRQAQAALEAAQQQFAASLAQVQGVTALRNHPAVAAAAATYKEQYLVLARTHILAPISGQVSRRTVQVGARVQPGAPLLSLVALDRLWVDANFKENQVARLRAGQPVRLTSDFYANDVVFHGTVQGVSSGTGASYALLPPQNATGNWIKVVQRLPVRINLTPEELTPHPLRIGLSMSVDVSVRDATGDPLATLGGTGGVREVDLYGRRWAGEADQAAARVIAETLAAMSR